ncbi:hypothetical protein AVEN_199233-1 [Araneus ventricosus]|uniref:Uncharacterized protein n=1 Tax=Araneus ventricosus TaxID=182803 RepID=A0A4Y2BGS5_ARAVE|nr:hypothetical protein AVEN_54207-1 [Araneus ventricosus]GBL91404.1 hypothetical protein AVEN_80350-1 [Araneus ventricosus]GBL91462.1 hypothetical protein AVEN_149185-1 [Araneus ventricosus]GBL91485.1 hypothetical protein AVEN_199233-1 [Araneus ventricosus]
MNTAKCSSTGQTAAFLTFGRELLAVYEVQNDLRSVILKDTFVPEINPYLKRFSKFMAEAKEVAEIQQDLRKKCGDRKRRKVPNYFPGDRVFVTTHHLSNAAKGRITKFMAKRDGPYIILTQKSPTSYVIANPDNPNEPVGTHHKTALKVYKQDESATPCTPLENVEDHERLILLVPHRDSLVEVGTRGESVTITDSPSQTVDGAARTFRNQKDDRQRHLSSCENNGFSLSRRRTNLAMLSELYNVM